MSENLLYLPTQSGVDFTINAFKLLQMYPHYCINDWYLKIEAYRKERGERTDSQANPNGSTDSLIRHAEDEIRKAQVVVRELTELSIGRQRMFTSNFEKKAEVYRRARIELGLTKIEDSPHLYAALKIEMAMLKADNSRFSSSRFLTYINSDGGTV